MLQELSSSQPPRRILAQTTSNEAPELPRRRRRRLRRISIANGTHQARPIPLLPNIIPKREPTKIKLQHAKSEAPDIAGVAIVDAVVEVGVNALRAHVSDGADRGVAGIHCLSEDAADAEISDLDTATSIDEEIRGFDVAVDDTLAVEIGEAGEDLAGYVGEERFGGDSATVEGAAVHVLEKDLDLAGVVVEAVAAYDEGVVSCAEDLDLAVDLAPDRIFVVAVNDF